MLAIGPVGPEGGAYIVYIVEGADRFGVSIQKLLDTAPSLIRLPRGATLREFDFDRNTNTGYYECSVMESVEFSANDIGYARQLIEFVAAQIADPESAGSRAFLLHNLRAAYDVLMRQEWHSTPDSNQES
jgi:hypothetical protein